MTATKKGGKGGGKGNGSKNMSSLLKGISSGISKLKISRAKKKTGAPPVRRPPRQAKTDANSNISQLAKIENADLKYNRKSEYPSNYDNNTHNNMALNWTKEGKNGEITIDANGNLVDGKGNPVKRDQLNWFDAKGNKIDFHGSSKSGNPLTNLTYEHKDSVVDHWNTIGYNSNRQTRNDFYNHWPNMEAMGRSDNSSGGGAMKDKYRQDVGANYTP